jgi:hypothetical protein
MNTKENLAHLIYPFVFIDLFIKKTMAANLYRTRAMFQIPRVIPALIARTQTTQTTPTAGKV